MSTQRSRARRLLIPGLVLAAGLSLSVVPAVTPGAAALAPDGTVRVEGLQANGRTDPLGIPGAAPQLSWRAVSAARGVVQTAYEIRVASSEDALDSADVWSSGKVASPRQVDVEYGGPALAAGTRYVWQVRTWDGADQATAWSEPATFETGLLDADDWGDAEWIGAPAGTEVDRWTDYTADIDFTIDNLVFAAFVRTANLNNGYLWQLSLADGTPRFRPHVKVGGSYRLLDNQDISASITAEELRTGQHTMSVAFDGQTITTRLDGEVIDTRTDATFAKGFVGFRASQATEGTEAATVHDVRVTAENGHVLLDTDFAAQGNPFSAGTLVERGLEIKGNVEALWRSPDDNLPLLRTDFETAADKTVTQARVYATARGIYELNLNGEKVGDQFLAPGWTDYEDRIQHQTYDVTELVTSGANSFGAELADGWWGGKVGMWGPGVYGNDLSLVARLRLDYSDGTSEWVDTDAESWSSHTGPYTFTDNIDGESYDARQEQPGWDEAGFDDAGWAAAVARPSATELVVPQPDEPVRATQELATVERTEPAPGAFVYDLGQNMVGVARMRLQGRAGTTVTIRYGEMLNPDGTLYTANLRAAKVTDRYTFAEDGTITYEPKFTQHGFRYVEIVGASTPPAAADVTGVVWESDLADTGELETSDPMLNQLASNISWGQRGNFLSIPTDTPARDERLGWTGDINVFAPTASYLKDTRAFLRKWMTDLRDSAYPNGNIPGVAPQPKGIDLGSGLGWSDAVITVPYAVWHSQGDTAIVRENYAAMTAYLDFVRAGAGPDLVDTARGNWDDWLNLDDPTPTGVLGTAYLAEDARMLAEMATAIGEDEDAAELTELSARVREVFAAELVAADGTVNGNSQTGYALALGMDLVPDEELRARVAARFVAKLASKNNHLSTGFLGTPWLLPALSSIGRDDLAYTLLTHKDFPSWGYEVENGATTMWERWDSIKPDGSFGDVGMNSFNHYAYGAVGDWMYQNIGGISALEAGYRRIRVAPVVGGGLTRGGGDYDSVYGRISTDWTVEGEDLHLRVDVPANTTAEVVLPAPNVFSATESGTLLRDADGVTGAVDDGDTVTVSVGSGSYDFQVVSANALLGSILEDLDTAQAHVGDLAQGGVLDGADRTSIDTALDGIREDVTAALLAGLEGDDAAVTASLEAALGGTRELRAWLAAADLDAAVRTDLDARTGRIEAQLVRALTSSMGVTVALPPVAGEALPGSTVSGTIEVTNDGTTPLTGLSGSVVVAGLGEASVELAEVPAGASAQLPVAIAVPRQQDPGRYDAELSLTYTAGRQTFTLTDTTPDWVTVTSGLDVGALTTALDGSDPSEHATVTVPLSNTGGADVRASVALTVPAGWGTVPSADVLVPAGGTAAVEVPVVLPLDRVGGAVPVTVAVRRAGVLLASAETTATFDLPTPPAAAVLDHVDFGNAASENAHGIQASASSGTNTEAGLTRRYAHSGYPGSWYSVTLDVPAGEPFILRNIETYDGPRTKKYHVYVDDVLVKTQLVPRSEPGAGTKVYDALIAGPAVTGNDGNVRVRFEFPTDAAGFYDPSIADLWVLAVPEDTQAPDVSAAVAAGTAGDAGWYRSDVSVAVSAADNRDPAPVVETGDGSTWQEYVGPVPVSGDGTHTVGFRARDAAGNSSGDRSVTVGIDTTAPATSLAVTRGPGVEGLDSATLRFEATDATSGVAATLYRVDGGPWRTVGQERITVTGFGEHTVEFASTDVAGNAETLRRETVTLADVDRVAALVAPQVTGTARLGSTLRATAGSWNTKGLAFGYQWLRNGSAIRGATGSAYRLGAADVGRRISVRVTATKPGKAPGTSVSRATAPVGKATSRTTVRPNRTRVQPGRPVTVAVRVVASGVKATGRAKVRVDGRVVRTVVVRNGRASVTVRIARRGSHRVTARYAGSATVAASVAAARTIRVG
ncbi:family 78 glycoside hydrolase catalytic domain [Nocardioides pantholopis]|uniref:family 78 glycoside hydrolase catalytic domain n=1 Tax=Nocardioides pantholopis TaxID=2483798 RepID=UPI000FD8EA41|nr:family 78 glycoside hydrolase catalytic domain [Nocardioides pantholopis]